ncbi:MAG: hypothetical protein IKV45_04795 [Firmicutes bacterium]|nr:hypothetical protein [Bacillota bacterium]
MGKCHNVWRRFLESQCAMLFYPGAGFVRVLVITSIVLLLLYSLVFHHFVITLVVLMQMLALIGTFFG